MFLLIILFVIEQQKVSFILFSITIFFHENHSSADLHTANHFTLLKKVIGNIEYFNKIKKGY